MGKLIALLMVLAASLMVGFSVAQAQTNNTTQDQTQNQTDDTPTGAPETGFGLMNR